MSSRFLRQSIATLLSLGALWSAGDVSAAAASSGVDVTCHNFSCVPDDPWDPGWGGGGWGGGGGGGDGDTSGGGGGDPGPGEPECPTTPGGNSLLPSLKALNCPQRSCEEHAAAKPGNCPNPIPRVYGWDAGRWDLRPGSPMARLMALGDANAPSGGRMLPIARGMILNALTQFNLAGPSVPLDRTRIALASGLQQACTYQRANGPDFMGPNTGWTTCADVAEDVFQELVSDESVLRLLLDELARHGINVDVASYGPISWSPARNSVAAHHANIDHQHACSGWWELNQQLGCGQP